MWYITIEELQLLFEESLIMKGANYDNTMDIPVTDDFIENELLKRGYSETQIKLFIEDNS